MNKSSSPSRTYVAMCSKSNFDGYYFRSFVLPEIDTKYDDFVLKNDSETASWYFLNRLDAVACIDGVITIEDYRNIKSVEEVQAEVDAMLAEAERQRLARSDDVLDTFGPEDFSNW